MTVSALMSRASALVQRVAADPVRREKLAAGAVFAAILAGNVAGTDFVITGGPSWNPGAASAYAMEYRHGQAPAPPMERAYPVAVEMEPAALEIAPVNTDYDPSLGADDLLGAADAPETAQFESAKLPVEEAWMQTVLEEPIDDKASVGGKT